MADRQANPGWLTLNSAMQSKNIIWRQGASTRHPQRRQPHADGCVGSLDGIWGDAGGAVPALSASADGLSGGHCFEDKDTDFHG